MKWGGKGKEQSAVCKAVTLMYLHGYITELHVTVGVDYQLLKGGAVCAGPCKRCSLQVSTCDRDHYAFLLAHLLFCSQAPEQGTVCNGLQVGGPGFHFQLCH